MTEPAAPLRTEPVLDNVTRADASDELASTTLLRAAIGPINTPYYLAIFTRFDAQDKTGPHWNTAAALSTLNWMLLRRMWNPALAYSGVALTVALLVFGIGKLVLHYSEEVQWALVGLYMLALVAVPGLWGNAWLFKHYRADMARAVAAHATLADAAAMLAARAPSRQHLALLLGLNLVVAAAVVAMVQWAASFHGLPTGLGAPGGSSATVASSAPGTNVAIGRALEASATAVPPPIAAPASAPASAVPATASAPRPSAPVANAAASAPTVAASDTTGQGIAYAGRGKVQPPPVSPAPHQQASAPSPRPPASAAAQPTPLRAPAVATPVSEKTAEAPGGASRYVINVGLFADDNNARNALVQLQDAGLPGYTQEIRGKKGKRTWVRVGPFEAMAQAEKTVDSVRALGLDAQVVKLPQ